MQIKYLGNNIELEDYIILMLEKGYSDVIEETLLPDGTIKGKWKNYITSENILINKNNIDQYKNIIEKHRDKVQDYKDYVDALELPKVLNNNKIKKVKKTTSKKKKSNIPEENTVIDFNQGIDFDQLNSLLEQQNSNFSYEEQDIENNKNHDDIIRERMSIAKQLTEGTYFENSEATDNVFEARKRRNKSGKNRFNLTSSSSEDLKKEMEENQYKDKSEQEVIRIKRNKEQVLNQMFN